MPQEGKNGTITYLPEDSGLFTEGTEIWEWLENGCTVTVDRHGLIIETYCAEEEAAYDRERQEFRAPGPPTDFGVPFDPSTATDAELDGHITGKSKQIDEEFNALSTMKRDLQLKWKELVAYNEERDKREGGYQRRSTFGRLRNRHPATA